MALEVFVMPIWRFKAGDFRSPLEQALGKKRKIVTGEGIEVLPDKVGWFQRWRAKREVRAIRKAVEKANKASITWSDEGDVVYTQNPGGFDSLRTYALWLDCRNELAEFTAPPEANYYKHPVWQLNNVHPSCPHLVGHDCYNGYFLPCEFEHLVSVEPYLIFGRWPAERVVGSSPRLLHELDFVQQTLQVPDDYQYPADDPLIYVKGAYILLREAAEKSCRHKLPIIFWG